MGKAHIIYMSSKIGGKTGEVDLTVDELIVSLRRVVVNAKGKNF